MKSKVNPGWASLLLVFSVSGQKLDGDAADVEAVWGPERGSGPGSGSVPPPL